MKIWFRIAICPSVIFFPDIFATITLIHEQIIAMTGCYVGGAFNFNAMRKGKCTSWQQIIFLEKTLQKEMGLQEGKQEAEVVPLIQTNQMSISIHVQ